MNSPWLACFFSLGLESTIINSASSYSDLHRRKRSLARAEKKNKEAAGDSNPSDAYVALLAYGKFVFGANSEPFGTLPTENSVD